MGSGFAKRKKEMRMMQEQLGKMQSELQNTEVVGTASNGLVTVTLSGEHEMKEIKIKPECVDPEDIEGLQDLIKLAYKDALGKINEKSMKNMPKMPGLTGFPGF